MSFTTAAIAGLALAGVASAQLAMCPSTPAPIYAACEMRVFFKNRCSEVQREVEARITGVNGWTCPKVSPGTYRLINSRGNFTEASRTTGSGQYTDLFNMEYQGTESGCTVNACSRSQVFSIGDGSTNYCNMYNVFCNNDDRCEVVNTELIYEQLYLSCGQNDVTRCNA